MISGRDAADLAWRFGLGSNLVERMAGGIPETGWVGNGNSGTKGAMSSSAGIDPATIARFGRVERALARLVALDRSVLTLAYGDAGAIVTDGGQLRDRRWQAVAALTEHAVDMGPAWAEANPSHGWSVERERAETARKRRRAETESDEQKLRRMTRENKARDASIGDPAARYVHALLSVGWSSLGADGRTAIATIEKQARELLYVAELNYAGAADAVAADTRDVRRTNEQNAAAAGVTAAQMWERGEG